MRFYNLCGGYALGIAFGILALMLSLVGSAGAATLTVYGSGGADYMRIQDAINHSSSGDTIFVYNGIYYENIILKDGIRVHGENVGMTTIDGVKATSVVTAVGLGSETVLDGFTITNGTTDAYGGGIYMQRSSVVIENNIIIFNSADAGGAGIFIVDDSSPTINGNIITYNGNSVAGGGIYVHGSFPTITNNIISENSAVYGGGVGFAAFSGGKLANNVILNNTAPNRGGGIDVYNYSSPNIFNNIIADNSGTGIHVSFESFPLIDFNDAWSNIGGNYGGDALPGANDITEDPIFVNSTITNYHLQAISPCIDVGNNTGAPSKDFDGNSRPIDGDGDGIAIVDMGVYEYIPVASTISGFKISDTNGNGRWDAGKAGIQGWNIVYNYLIFPIKVK